MADKQYPILEIIKQRRGVYALRFSDVTIKVSESLLTDYYLYVGKLLSDEQINQLAARFDDDRAYQKALDLISRRDYFTAELRLKLQQRVFTNSSIEQALIKLTKAGYLDELACARRAIEQRIRSESVNKVRQRLQKRGCPRRIIEELMPEFSCDEVLKAFDTLTQKYRYRQITPDHKSKQQQLRFLINRGYSYRDAERAYQKWLKAYHDEENY